MAPNVRHLHVFCEVARHESISAASRSIHLTQPAVTQAVASVEAYFGAALFNRGSTGMTLTDAGTACQQRIERALEQIAEGVAEATRSTRSDKARLITTAQLRSLCAVIEHGSFSVAARALHLSQPTIHRAARELERVMGVVLFEKTSFGVRPTRESEKLGRRANLAFAEIAQARAEVSALSGEHTGGTVIGAMPLARTFLVPKALVQFTAENPDHDIAIVEGPYENLRAGLLQGKVDFLVGALRDPSALQDIVQEHLFDDPLAVIVRAGHPLAGSRRVTVKMLAEFPWIAPRLGSPLREHFNELFKSANIAPPPHPIDCNSLVAARSLLLESDRVMLLSAHQIHYELQAGLLAALPHPRGKVVRSIGLTFRRDWHPTNHQRRLLDQLRRQAEAVSG
jgi:DNA-binding transcriptional LysR family regulator